MSSFALDCAYVWSFVRPRFLGVRVFRRVSVSSIPYFGPVFPCVGIACEHGYIVEGNLGIHRVKALGLIVDVVVHSVYECVRDFCLILYIRVRIGKFWRR